MALQNTTFPFPEIFKGIVADISNELTAQLQEHDPNITGVHYIHGHIIEISNTLVELSTNPTTELGKYPLVMLLEDLGHNRGKGYSREEHYATAYLQIVIATGTDQYMKSDEREVETFIPILNPIYERLLEKVAEYPLFAISPDPEDLQHKVYPRKFWGTHYINVEEKGQKDRGVEKLILKDYVDAIDIQDLRITIQRHNNCEIPNNQII